MALSYDLISQFAKLTSKNEKTSSESTVYGTIVADANGNKYVKLDGSDQLTPLTDDERPSADATSANANEGERVSVLIKNHTATITGNISSPAARTGDVEKLEDNVTKIQEFDILIGEQIQAQEGYIQKLQTDKANVGDLTAATARITELEANSITTEDLKAERAEIDDILATKIDAEVVESTYATLENLESTNADITNLNTDYVTFKEATGERISANEADIKELDTKKMSADQADLKYANIDFGNIGEAAIRKIFSDSGLIADLVVGDGTITGELIGVTIKGDLIEGNTVKADKLVVLGDDGLYYKLNFNGATFGEGEVVPNDSLHGSIITANSITAEKISVYDLVAFGATIGGFNITSNSLYSGVKRSIDNTTRGIYLDNDGQMSVGDADNFLKYYKDTDGSYKLELSFSGTTLDDFVEDTNTKFEVQSDKIDMNFETTTKSIDEVTDSVQTEIEQRTKHIEFSDDGITLKAGGNSMTLKIDNNLISFEKNGVQFGWWDGVDFHTGNIAIDVTERAQFGNFAYVPRTDGSLSFLLVRNSSDFYTLMIGDTLAMCGVYPTMTDTTMILDNITNTIDGSTLILGG